MAKGHLSEDTIKFIVTAESDQLQQEIHKSIMTGMSLVMDEQRSEILLRWAKKFDLFWSFLLTFDHLSLISWFYVTFALRMKKYSIEVLEVLSRIVEVEASDEKEAIEQVRQMYRKCEIVLDDSDYKMTEISAKDEKSGQSD